MIKHKLNIAIRKLNANQVIILGFFIIILVGTLFLCMPIASASGRSNGVLTALFTSTSATCVTGLALGDTYHQWSLFGQVVILMLIQIGGLGFMSVASLFLFSLKRKVDLRTLFIMAQSVGTDNVGDAIRIQKKILKCGLSVEALGALILSIRFAKWYSAPKAIWLGIFHSISAFCNAGFDILGFESEGGSLIPFQTDSVILITISVVIIIGGIGFAVWDDLTRTLNPAKWSVYTKIVLCASFVLLILGTTVFFILEFSNSGTIGDMCLQDKIINSFFQATTTRTAGFTAIDQAKLTETGKIITILLMFVGGASCSTAGGLKVGTLVVIVLFLLSRMRGKENVNVFYRKISETQIMNALCLFGMMTLFSVLGSIIICGTTNFRFIDGLYETVSALATVGLSTGVLSGTGLACELLLIVYMFFGRIGILTISMGFLQSTAKYEDIKFPEVNLPIG